jgi:hypothetical protein
MSQQGKPDSHLWIIRIATAIAFVAVLRPAGLIPSGARAADPRCPTKRCACWQVRLAVNSFGERTTVDRAKACG